MSIKQKTLVFLTPAFPANESEENWISFQQILLRSITKLYPGIKIIVLSFIYPHAISNYNWNDIEVFSFDGMRYKKFRRPLLWRKIWRKLNAIKKEHKITVIFSLWCGECALIGRYFGKRNSINHFVWICGQDARKRNRMVKLIRPSSNELIAMSDFLVDEFFLNHHIKPAHLIPPGVDLSMYGSATSVRDIDIIGAGSLSILKQYDVFVDVIAGLKNTMPGIKAVLCGDGEDSERISKMQENYSLQQNLELTGMLTPRETIRKMQRSKIMLHPSSYEGFSMACYEALYAGAHVISFVKSMYHDIPHWHVVGSKEEMQQKAFELLNDPQLANEPIFTYSMDDSTKKLMHLFDKNIE
jgi:glycosyltransferase involved in cell wall biosynthesis